MSYLVLARRWRPQRFDELVGQPHVSKTILNGIKQGRIAHAYVFSGPRGVGKTTTARLFAKAMNCENSRDGEPCNECKNCKAISEGRFIDVIEIDAASNTGVDDVRSLRDGIRYSPIEGKVKVYVIDEVHMLSPQAFNALLKTLEEPPAHGYFCLATTESQKIPATILSRCQRFDFRRVSSAEIKAHLKKICDTDNIPYEEDALDLIARRADGSVRDGLSLLDQVIAYSGGEVLKQDAIDVAGEIKLDMYMRTIDILRKKSTREAFKLDFDLASQGTDPQDFLMGVEEFLIHLTQIKSMGAENVDIPPDFIEDMEVAARQLTEADLIRLLKFVTDAENDIRKNFNPRVRLQLLLLKFATFENSLVLSDLIKKTAKLQKQQPLPKQPTPEKQQQPPEQKPKPVMQNNTTAEQPTQPNPQPEATANTQITQPETQVSTSNPSSDEVLNCVQNKWDNICHDLSKDFNVAARMIQQNGSAVAFKDGHLRINLTNDVTLAQAKSCAHSLQAIISNHCGNVILDFHKGEIQAMAETESENYDEKEQELVDKFNARLIN